jgi:hypothetical protein
LGFESLPAHQNLRMNVENRYFECACHSDEHRLVFQLDLDDKHPEIYVSQFMHHWNPWWKRVWIAIRYVFGYKCKYGHFDCWIMKPEDAEKLRSMLDEFIKNSKEDV